MVTRVCFSTAMRPSFPSCRDFDSLFHHYLGPRIKFDKDRYLINYWRLSQALNLSLSWINSSRICAILFFRFVTWNQDILDLPQSFLMSKRMQNNVLSEKHQILTLLPLRTPYSLVTSIYFLSIFFLSCMKSFLLFSHQVTN